MAEIKVQGSRISYYGNNVGYLEGVRAVVDTAFRGEELEHWLTSHNLTPSWEAGVYDRLISGTPGLQGEDAPILKNCRIWQLKPDVDVMMKFIGYREVTQRFGGIDPANYDLKFDGQVVSNDLEDIFAIFNIRHPPDFTGHSLSMSDVVELYDGAGSEFHYVDASGFQPIDFTSEAHSPTMAMM